MQSEREKSNHRILDDITVLDLSTFVTGGFATAMLANQGAEVIKVERPGVGDDNRYSGPPFVNVGEHNGPGRSADEKGESPYFWTVNYGKQSIELNLKKDDGQQVLYDLVNEVDVVVENFRPGTAERLGVDYETLREYNEDIIYCTISAFGETGPWKERPGYDLLIQGMSGLMTTTGYPDSPPTKVGVPQTDLITAMWAGFGIVISLYRYEQTGKGDRIELSMLDAVLPWLTKQAGKAFVGDEPKKMGTKDPVLAPYQMFPSADGYINVACGNQRLWEQFATVVGREDLLKDERFTTNSDRVEHMEMLETELSETLQQRTTEEWVELLASEHELPVGPVYTVKEALNNEQIKSRDVVRSMDHPAVGAIPVIEHPLNYKYSDAEFTEPPPLLGEDTAEVLFALGYDEDKIEQLVKEGVIPDIDLPQYMTER